MISALAPYGTFTQEDPIGIAGGLNLYGYANGDPVNFSDPFGLCPPEDDNLTDCPGFFTTIGVAAGALFGGFGGGAGGAVVCSPGGPAALACAGAGGAGGAAQGAAWGAAIGGAIDAGIFLFSNQSQAVNRAEGLRATTDDHLAKIRRNPNSRDVAGWTREINAHLDEISRMVRRMGRRTGNQWRDYVRQVRGELDELIP